MRVIIITTGLSGILFGKHSQIATVAEETVITNHLLPLTGRQGHTNHHPLLPVLRHPREAAEAGVREVAVGAAAEAALEAGHREVTKRFLLMSDFITRRNRI